MAVTFPLALNIFQDDIGIESVNWRLQENKEYSGQGSGAVLESNLGPSLWMADISTRPWNANKAREIEAMINIVQRSNGSFLLHDPRRCYPSRDPNGLIIAGSNVQINSLPTPATLSLKGLPANYQLRRGDYLAFTYASAPTRYALHEVAENISANAGGVTAAFEVSPFIRSGAAVNNAVTLVKAAAKFIVVPGSLRTNMAGPSRTVVYFSAVQKI